MWLYGLHAVAAALANPRRRQRRLLVANAGLAARFVRPGIAATTVTADDLADVLPNGAVHQGVALETAPLPPVALSQLWDTLDRVAGDDRRRPLLVLDQITDPRNVGAILRAAAAFGALGCVQQARHAPVRGGALAKAASGALEVVPLVEVPSISRALGKIRDAGFWRIGLDAAGDRTLRDPRPAGPVALVLGAEGSGLRRLTREHCDEVARIPMAGDAGASLNVANAAAVALYELTRD